MNSGPPTSGNLLAGESSAYLRQHAHHPVHWQPFGDTAFEEAAERDVPVFLSIGYAACHWCHVMADESFADEKTAAHLNAGFVAIKVDREERPDVDATYMAATQMISGQGGWPMSVFLTPQGRAFHAGTYFPVLPMPGLPSFLQVLDAVQEAWRERRDDVERQAYALASTIGEAQSTVRVKAAGETPVLDPGVLSEAVTALLIAEDTDDGGFGTAPKFPPSAVLEFLVRHAAVPSATADAAKSLAGRTLAAMARSALFDQVAGGFARYSVSADWSEPHYEKMLYDNALLLRAYVHWLRLGGSPEYPAAEAREVAELTADWMLSALALPDGLASSLDADTVVDGKHHEGGTYIWTVQQLITVLGRDDGEAVARLMNIPGSAPGEDTGAPFHQGKPRSRAESELWRRVLPLLRIRRAQRPQPARDDKVVAGWNGLAVGALAEAGALLDRPDLTVAAAGIATFLQDTHWVARPEPRPGDAGTRAGGETPPVAMEQGTLLRVSHAGRAAGRTGLLEDYAFCAEGFFTLYAVTGETCWYAYAQQLVEAALVDFMPDGHLVDSAVPAIQVLSAQDGKTGLDPFDNATPSGMSAFAGVLLTSAAYTGSREHRQQADRILALLPSLAARAPRVAGGLLSVAQAAAAGPVECAVVGPADSTSRTDLHRNLLGSPSPGLVIAVGTGDEQGPVLLRGRTSAASGAPRVFLCKDMVCQRPVESSQAMLEQLAQMTAKK